MSRTFQPELGVIGTGRMGSRLAAMFARAGRKVVIGSREPARAQQVVGSVGSPNLVAGDYEAALAAPAILPAVFVRDGLLDLLDFEPRPTDGQIADRHQQSVQRGL